MTTLRLVKFVVSFAISERRRGSRETSPRRNDRCARPGSADEGLPILVGIGDPLRIGVIPVGGEILNERLSVMANPQ